MADVKARLADLDERIAHRGAGSTEDAGDRADLWWRHVQSKLVERLEALMDPMNGIMSDTVAEPFGWGVRKRYEFARSIQTRSIEGQGAVQRWSTAIAAIAASPRYAGLQLAPQLGLLPIGADPDSGLWEFAHLQTGEAPERGVDGRLAISEETGLVLVLLPAGKFVMGAQKDDPNQPNFDALAADTESPPTTIVLDAFFLSKYEMTQAQWLRMTGANPSSFKPTYYPSGWEGDLRHPVERVSWDASSELLARMRLALPTEAQWEYGARGGTSTRWWSGNDRETLQGAINLADGTALEAGAPWPECFDWPELQDGFRIPSVSTTWPETFGSGARTGWTPTA